MTSRSGFNAIQSGIVAFAFLAALVSACGGGKASLSTEDGLKLDTHGKNAEGGGKRAGSTRSRCDASAPDRETSEYDTSGDGQPDVFKVFRRIGTPPLARLILSCREVDLNADSVKDVIRQYDDEGRPLREEADRDFDGKAEAISFYQHGEVMRREVDTNADGIVDVKVFFDKGKPMRSERDLSGRSTVDKWKPDRWEYYEQGRLVRMGTDRDGDGRVDRWDRDEEASRAARKAKEEAKEEADAETDADTYADADANANANADANANANADANADAEKKQ